MPHPILEPLQFARPFLKPYVPSPPRPGHPVPSRCHTTSQTVPTPLRALVLQRLPPRARMAPRSWEDFLKDWAHVTDCILAPTARGCRYCLHNCFANLAGKQDAIERWRSEFRRLNPAVQDREILWLFFNGRGRATQPNTEQEATSPSEEATCAATSPSEEARSTECANRMHKPTAQTHREHEATSSSEERQDNVEAELTSAAPTDSEENTSRSERSSSLDCESPTKRPRRTPNDPKRSYSKRVGSKQPSVPFLGHLICRHAARYFMALGASRVDRATRQNQDGRRKGFRLPAGHRSLWSTQRVSCCTFIWYKYQQEGEGMPHKFSFERGDTKSPIVCSAGARPQPGPIRTGRRQLNSPAESEEEGGGSDDAEDEVEEEQRAITAAVLYAASLETSDATVAFGPGMAWGPLRFLPPCRRVHLYWEYVLFCKQADLLSSSFATFLRVIRESRRHIRIRKSGGEHAVCDECAMFKKTLRALSYPAERQTVMEKYSRHLMDQWLDRQVDANNTILSLQCRKALQSGFSFANLARNLSHLAMCADGVDQAKFRCPRVLIKTHNFDKLLRPAMHVQGVWAHGFGFHLAVSDADCKKDTVMNIESISRLLEASSCSESPPPNRRPFPDMNSWHKTCFARRRPTEPLRRVLPGTKHV